MTTFNAQLDELFEEWRAHPANEGGVFIPDGEVDEEQWRIPGLKIMVLLKEANSDHAGWTYQKFIRDGGYELERTTWPTLIRWVYGLLHGFPEIKEVDEHYQDIKQQARDFFRNVYFGNVKKITGGPIADDAKVSEYAKQTSAFLVKEIEILQPQVVLCCGNVVYQAVTQALQKEVRSPHIETDRTPGGLQYTWWGDIRTRIVRYHHPNAYYPREMSYTYLMREMHSLL